MTGMRRIAAVSLAAVLAAAGACVMRKDGPALKRFTRVHPFPVTSTIHRAGDLEMQLISGSTMQVFTVLGSDHWTVNIRAKLNNKGSRPLTIPIDSIGVLMTKDDQHPSVAYYREVRLEPGDQQEVNFAIPAGLRYFERPYALQYRGVRMNLQ
jgi:hypothetical protein